MITLSTAAKTIKTIQRFYRVSYEKQDEYFKADITIDKEGDCPC